MCTVLSAPRGRMSHARGDTTDVTADVTTISDCKYVTKNFNYRKYAGIALL